MPDFESLRDRVALWKQEQEAWEAIERKGESMLHLIAAAELALEEGNPERAETLARIVEEDLRGGMVEDWGEDEDAETLEDEEEEEEVETLEVEEEAEADGLPEPEPEPVAAPSKKKFSDLRDMADHRESQEDDELDKYVEDRLESVGYYSDAILDGEGIKGKMISDKYEEIRELIDRAEAADKVGNSRESDRLLQEAEDLL